MNALYEVCTYNGLINKSLPYRELNSAGLASLMLLGCTLASYDIKNFQTSPEEI